MKNDPVDIVFNVIKIAIIVVIGFVLIRAIQSAI